MKGSKVKTIELNHGCVALVDDEDYEPLSRYKWGESRGYAHRSTSIGRRNGHSVCRTIMMHREIVSPSDDIVVDHINHNTLDNRRSNLRTCARVDNCRNRTLDPRSATPMKGVYWQKNAKKWHAQINVNNEMVYLGLFSDLRDAGRAYDEAAVAHFGEFALTNAMLGLL